MLLPTYIFLLTLGFCLSSLGSKVDFCDSKMCPHQGVHVACNKTKDFSSECPGQAKLENLKPYISMILEEHNYYRNLIASGELQCFYPAGGMAALKWDWGLVETAEHNVRSCVFAHDQCRSTTKFPYAGQNIYMAKTSRDNVTVEGCIKEAMFLWFSEQFDADNELLQYYQKTSPQTGHFTLMVNDQISHIGCALVIVNLNGFTNKRLIILTCNYSYTNIRGRPSYKPGPPASKCKKRHAKYTALCEDPIDSNDQT